VDRDVRVIRSEIRDEDIEFRTAGVSADRLRSIRKGLLTLHTLELMAINVYRFQIGRKVNELNRQLIVAMCNEMTHYQDFQVKLLEYGSKPSRFRWIYWIVGCLFGIASKLMGPAAILRTGIWVETKALAHYGELLALAEWDQDTRRIIEKNRSDEDGHISRWQKLIKSSSFQTPSSQKKELDI
jgi:ubiquinone biosynthesis monooxygenase Coq7